MGWISDLMMGYRLSARVRLAIALCLVLVALAHADRGWHGGGGGYNGGGYNGGDGGEDTDDDGSPGNNNGWWGNPGSGGTGNGDGDGSGSSGGSNGRNGNNRGAGFDIASATYFRNAHGIVASVAFIGLFPLGSILMRVLPGKLALWVHAIFQMVSLAVYIAAVGLGIYLVRTVRIPFGNGGNLLTNEATRYHPIIGLVILVLLIIQPMLGYIHHKKYKRLLRRQVWSYLHIFNGRIAVTVGIINGGLGLNLANASDYRKRVYIIVAAVMWGLWMAVAIVSEIVRARRTRVPRSSARTSSRRGSGPPVEKPMMSTSPGARRSED